MTILLSSKIGRANLSGFSGLLIDVAINMAGLLAEEKFHGVRWDWESDAANHLRAVRAGEPEADPLPWGPTDLRKIALAFCSHLDPEMTFNALHHVLLEYRNRTSALLDAPRVWGGVERVATALVRRRYLSPRRVRELLGEAFFAGQASVASGDRVSDDF